jgi:molecular chaperone DnaK
MRDAGDKIKAEDRREVENKTNALKDAQKSDNIEEIKAKTQDLSQAIQKIGAELYKQQGHGPQGTPPEEKKDDPSANSGQDAEEGKYKEK